MATVKQIEANQQNAARSTGPRTPEGKRASALSATRHGLCASGAVLVPGDDPDEFRVFAERMISEIDPQTQLESILTERLISLAWRLRRAPRVEAELVRWHWFEEKIEAARAEVASYEDVVEDEDFEEHEVVTNPRLHARAVRALDDLRRTRDAQTTLGRAFRRASGAADHLGLAARYERSLEAAFVRTLHELQRVQAARCGSEVPLPVAVDVQVHGENGFVR